MHKQIWKMTSLNHFSLSQIYIKKFIVSNSSWKDTRTIYNNYRFSSEKDFINIKTIKISNIFHINLKRNRNSSLIVTSTNYQSTIWSFSHQSQKSTTRFYLYIAEVVWCREHRFNWRSKFLINRNMRLLWSVEQQVVSYVSPILPLNTWPKSKRTSSPILIGIWEGIGLVLQRGLGGRIESSGIERAMSKNTWRITFINI